MKGSLNSLLIALFLLLPSAQDAFCKPKRTPTPTPTPKPRPELVCRTKQQDLELRDWIIGIQNEAANARNEVIAAQRGEAEVRAQLDKATIDATNLANECAKDKECAKAPFSCWFHRFTKHLFWVVGGVLILIVGLCIASFFFPALGPILSFLVGIWNKLLGLFKPKPPTG